MPPARTLRSKVFLYALFACIAAAIMLRSFCTFDQWTLARPHTLSYLRSGDGFLSAAYVSTANRMDLLGFFRTTSPIRPVSLSAFEDESLFKAHLKRSYDGLDAEIYGFRIILSCSDERNILIMQLPLWTPVAAFSLLASAGFIRRAAHLLRPRTSSRFVPLCNAAPTADPTPFPA